MKPTFVLVHGAYHGGWCWAPVAQRLEAGGCRVFTPTLSGLADRSHLLSPEIGLDTHIADIAGFLRWNDLTDVVLVGHSYAGCVIGGVYDREPDRIARAMFLDAGVLHHDDAFCDFLPEGIVKALHAAAIDGYRLPPPPPVWFGVPEDHPRAGWLAAHLTAHPLRSLTDRIQYSGAGLPPPEKAAYIACINDAGPDFAQHAARARDLCWPVQEIATGHHAPVTDPDGLSALICAAW